MAKKKIAILVCYLGPFPWYFDYFVHSCAYNRTIDFFIISDHNYLKVLPPNFKIVQMTIQEINRLASRKLGFLTNINSGYKLCDFKPAYGLLFSDIIKGYYFWGYADIDIIFGDIREFISDEMMENYDLISVRHDFLPGQFLLFRNNSKMNNLFTLSRDYRKVLSSDQHYCYDETNFQWKGFTEGKHYKLIQSEIESMTHLVKRLEEENYLKAYFDFHVVEGVPGNIRWDNGKLFYKNTFECLLYHLVLFKKHCKPRQTTKKIPEIFEISPSTIRHRKTKSRVGNN